MRLDLEYEESSHHLTVWCTGPEIPPGDYLDGPIVKINGVTDINLCTLIPDDSGRPLPPVVPSLKLNDLRLDDSPDETPN